MGGIGDDWDRGMVELLLGAVMPVLAVLVAAGVGARASKLNVCNRVFMISNLESESVQRHESACQPRIVYKPITCVRSMMLTGKE